MYLIYAYKASTIHAWGKEGGREGERRRKGGRGREGESQRLKQ